MQLVPKNGENDTKEQKYFFDATSHMATVLNTKQCHQNDKIVTKLIYIILYHMGQKNTRTFYHQYFKEMLMNYPSFNIPTTPPQDAVSSLTPVWKKT